MDPPRLPVYDDHHHYHCWLWRGAQDHKPYDPPFYCRDHRLGCWNRPLYSRQLHSNPCGGANQGYFLEEEIGKTGKIPQWPYHRLWLRKGRQRGMQGTSERGSLLCRRRKGSHDPFEDRTGRPNSLHSGRCDRRGMSDPGRHRKSKKAHLYALHRCW